MSLPGSGDGGGFAAGRSFAGYRAVVQQGRSGIRCSPRTTAPLSGEGGGGRHETLRPSLCNLFDSGLPFGTRMADSADRPLPDRSKLCDGVRLAPVITHSARAITVSECMISHVVRAGFEGSRRARKNDLCRRIVEFIEMPKTRYPSPSGHSVAPSGRSGTDPVKGDRPAPCRSGNIPEIHDDQSPRQQPHRAPIGNHE